MAKLDKAVEVVSSEKKNVVESNPPIDDDFAERLERQYEHRAGHPTLFTEPSDAEDTLDDELRGCLHCLTLIDRVRQRQILRDSLLARALPQSKRPVAHLERLAHFEIEKELGRGGAGMVFLATDTRLHRKVAIKVPHPQFLITDELRQRFLREVEASARLNHPHIVRVYEAGAQGPLTYLASEYCEGNTLADWLATQTEPVSPKLAASIVRDLAEAVQHAHTQAVIHRDIKPSNVLIAGSRSEGVESIPLTKLCDFGLAKVLDDATNQTHTGDLLGTPAYMPPEQAQGSSKDVDVRSDVYALGAILFELLTGSPPFAGENRASIVQKVIHDEPRNVRGIRKDVPLDLAVIVAKTLAKSKADRYLSAKELADDLGRYLDGLPISARPITWWERSGKWVQRRPIVAGSILVMTLSLLAILITLANTNVSIRRSLEQVSAAERKAVDEAHRSRILLYAADLRNADEAIRQQNVVTARATLEKYVPKEGESDLRTWPWYYLWQLSARPKPLVAKGNALLDVEYSTDGTVLYGGHKNGEVVAWDSATGSELWRQRAHLGNVTAISFSSIANKLYSVGDDGGIREWTGETHRLLVQLTPGIQEMAVSPDGKTIATGNQWGQVSVVDVSSGKLKKLLRAHGKVAGIVDFSPDGRWLLSGSEDGHIRLWSTIDYRKIAELGLGSKILDARFSADSRRIALAMRQEHSLVVVSILENAMFQEVADTTPIVTTIAFPDPSTIVSVSGISADGTTVFGDLVKDGKHRAFRWTEETGVQTLGSLMPDDGASNARAITPDGKVIVGEAESKDGLQGFRWTEEKGMQGIGELAGGQFLSSAVGVSPDGKKIIGCSHDEFGHELMTWTEQDGCRVLGKWRNPNPLLLKSSGTPQAAACLSKQVDGRQVMLIYDFTRNVDVYPPIDWSVANINAIADDGGSFVGQTVVKGELVSFRWSRNRGYQLLDFAQTDFSLFVPQSMSSDGVIIAGTARSGDANVACLWATTETGASGMRPHGFRTLPQWLREKGLSKRIDRWVFEDVAGISADGLSFTGVGRDSSGQRVAWVLHVPASSYAPTSTEVELAIESRCITGQAPINVCWVDKDHAAAGTVQGAMVVVATSDGSIVGRRRASESRINSMVVHPSTDQITTGAGDGEIIGWPVLHEWTQQLALRKDFGHARFSQDASDPTQVTGYLGSKSIIMCISSHAVSKVLALKVPSRDVAEDSPNGKWKAIELEDGATSVLDRVTNSQVSQVESERDARMIAWTPISNRLVTLTTVINVWDPATGRLLDKFGRGNNKFRTCVAVSKDESILVCSQGTEIEVWNFPRKELLATLTGHTASIEYLAISPDGQTLASASIDHSVRLWDLKRFQLEAVLMGHTDSVTKVVWFPDGQSLASVAATGGVLVWDRRTQHYVLGDEWDTGNHQSSIALTSDSRELLVLDPNERRIHFFDAGPDYLHREEGTR